MKNRKRHFKYLKYVLGLLLILKVNVGISKDSKSKNDIGIFKSGTFFVGANYWASHAGTAMWSDWHPDIVEKDFQTLSEKGINYLRVFPLWSDFQPISLLRKWNTVPADFRFGEEPLPDTPAGKAGVSEEKIQHFEEFTKLAEKYNIKLIVGLVTGWMSGRLFVPPALEGLNPITDTDAIMWETRFVKYFVSHFKNSPAIIAWDLGNECNVMGHVEKQSEAWCWVSTITNAIKSEDNSRLVISGMHSLKTGGDWTIMDQAEITDILTTHAYSSPTYGSDREPANTIRTVLHPTINTVMWQDIGQKPCFVEETGIFGPMQASLEVTSDYARNSLFSLWAHDCKGFMWWCAFEQDHLDRAPYDWLAVERELGMFYKDWTPKPATVEISKFNQFIESFPLESLPKRIIDGVCILPSDGDSWQTTYSTFVLAKQAGLDLEIQDCTQPIRDAKLYLLPSMSNWSSSITKHRMNELLEKVRAGATLYMSVGNAFLSEFNEITGLKVISREQNSKTDIVTVQDMESGVSYDLPMSPNYKLNLDKGSTKIIASDQDGNPAFTMGQYGKGKVFFLNYPMEKSLYAKPGVFHDEGAKPYYLIYKQIKESIQTEKVVSGDNPMTGITEHIVDKNTRIVIAINYTPENSKTNLVLKSGWKIVDVYYGEKPNKKEIEIGKNDASVIVISNK